MPMSEIAWWDADADEHRRVRLTLLPLRGIVAQGPFSGQLRNIRGEGNAPRICLVKECWPQTGTPTIFGISCMHVANSGFDYVGRSKPPSKLPTLTYHKN